MVQSPDDQAARGRDREVEPGGTEPGGVPSSGAEARGGRHDPADARDWADPNPDDFGPEDEDIEDEDINPETGTRYGEVDSGT